MNFFPASDALASLRWRYAVRKFDPLRVIPPDQWRTLEQSLLLCPSSFGLQPWRFYVLDHAHHKSQLPAISWGQSQVRDASHVVVFTARETMTVADVDRYLARIVEVRGVTPESLAGLRRSMLQTFDSPTSTLDLHEWAIRQIYIALGSFLTTAAMMGIDACPMEGIVAPKYDEFLGCREDGYHTVVACAAGYRAEDDKHAGYAKVRFPSEDVVRYLDVPTEAD